MAVTILGIETSCDETSAAVAVDGREVRSNIVSSQVKLHEKYGGIVPEIASRAHIESIEPMITEAIAQAGFGTGSRVSPAGAGGAGNVSAPRGKYAGLDAIAVTSGPGLIGSL